MQAEVKRWCNEVRPACADKRVGAPAEATAFESSLLREGEQRRQAKLEHDCEAVTNRSHKSGAARAIEKGQLIYGGNALRGIGDAALRARVSDTHRQSAPRSMHVGAAVTE